MTDATKLALPGDCEFVEATKYNYDIKMPHRTLPVGRIERGCAKAFAAAMNKAVDDAYAAGLAAAKQEADSAANGGRCGAGDCERNQQTSWMPGCG